ncbi:glycosyltransferase family 1 protein [Paucibacter sp. DJ1R-11]|uniref:glycosyltransferase family 4 protein n=1 Tax=unclassified Roseateles TaxID=2626991 RepID=UPI0021E38DE3|nr:MULTISPECIES: glycosyltransferase family 1 protein [unclassified Roseateles]MCV2365664.1 glycosyltransferase family 1 protein [Paucibacter sp. DJ1R-11]MCV2420098.1 glycosyltransferase family 1 protein [Paucibacter sp. DJ4R-1]MCV2436975.1 glycosyltransferase family 1 protein [Paucibacter sp. DJ2R-2]
MEPTPSADSIVVDNYPAAQRSLRIAVVTETYPPEVNGVAMTLARIVEGLHRRNHDVQLIRPRQDASDAAERTVRFHEVLMRGLPIPRYPNLRMGVPSKKALVQLWSVHRPDVVHIATEGALGWSALQAAVHLKLPVSSDFRTNFHAYSRHYGIGWLYKPIMAYLRKFHNRTQCTMVPTEALKRDLEAGGFKQLTVVSRGVDIQQFSPGRRSAALRAEWGVAEDDLVVVYVGRLAPEKNLATLTAAFEAVLQVQPRARLVVVGSGPQQAELQARWPQAIFAGQRKGEDLAAHYASGDLFLFPSLTETFGNVTTEAMASGLPVLAFDYAAAAQLIRNGENGVLAPMDDTAAFVRAATHLAGQPALRRQMGAAAALTASELDWSTIVARFEGVLDTVMLRAAQPVSLSPGLVGKTKRPAV